MEAAWIKNYGDDLYLQCTYTCILVLDRGLAHASKNDKIRRHRPGRDETTPPIQRCGVDVFVNTSLSVNIDSFEQLTTRIGRLRLKRRGSTPALTVFVVYAPTSNYDEEEVEAFYMDLERFYREDHTFFKVITGDFNAKIGPRRSSEERHIGTHGLEWNEQGERLSEFIMATKTIHSNSQFQKPHCQRWDSLRRLRANFKL
uniref:Endo/exonuclease/phosphatase domain-containing protein n=1 Tax=Angiostrongylus cantonensis TaxID=6313 RepID=A0A0K0D337_ANGCA